MDGLLIVIVVFWRQQIRQHCRRTDRVCSHSLRTGLTSYQL